MTFTTKIHYEMLNKASLPYLRLQDPNWDHIDDWKRDLKTAYGLTINDTSPYFHWSQEYWSITFDTESDCTMFLLRFS